MQKEILLQIKNRLEKMLASSPLPLPLEINRELNILYMVYQKNTDMPVNLEKHFKSAIKLTRKLNETIFNVSSINESLAKNLKAYLLSTARDIFAVMSVLDVKEKAEFTETTFLEEGLALLASQGAELSLLEAAQMQKKVQIERIAYELLNDLWDISIENKKIKNPAMDEIEAIDKKIETLIDNVKKAQNPHLYAIGIYNFMVYSYLINLLKKVEKAIEKL